MIVAIDGGLGAGKSYTGAWLAYQEHLSGRPVYSNAPIVFAHRVSSWQALMSIRFGMFVWQEAHLDIDSRAFATNQSITPWLTQTRKLGVDIVYDTQNFGQVDKRLRDLTDILIRCSKITGEGGRGTRLVVVDLFNERIMSDTILMHSQEVYKLYDSYALILPLVGKVPSLAEIYG